MGLPARLVQTRREFLRKASLAASFFAVPGVFAEELMRQTPWVMQGPLYPDKLPLDTDNDLIVVSNSVTPAVGEITHLSGRLLDRHGQPVRNTVIQISQADNKATYLKERSHKAPGSFGPDFQGFGRLPTGARRQDFFSTLQPVPSTTRPAP